MDSPQKTSPDTSQTIPFRRGHPTLISATIIDLDLKSAHTHWLSIILPNGPWSTHTVQVHAPWTISSLDLGHIHRPSQVHIMMTRGNQYKIATISRNLLTKQLLLIVR